MAVGSRKLVVEFVGDTSNLEKAFNRAGDTSRRRGQQINAAAKGIALGVGGIAVAAVKTAADYQTSMNTLQAVSSATGKQMKQLGQLAIKLGADTQLPATSAKDASEAMTEMVKSGVSLKDTMQGVRSTLVLSAAAGVSNARAAEIASNALNTFKLRGKQVAAVADELANTANASSVEINDVADALQMAGAVFSGFQAPVLGAKGALTELNVAIGLLGNAGIKGSDAGTSLKQTLLQLTGPSNKSKDAMKALFIAAKDAGASQKLLADVTREGATVRGKDLAALIAHNKALGGNADIAYTAAGSMRSLKDIIALVTEGTSKMTQEEKNSYLTQIFGADATRSIIALMKAGPSAWDKMTESVTKQGTAQQIANAKMKGLNGAIESLKSTAETLAITFGTTLLPPLTMVIKKMAGLGPFLQKNKTLITIVVGALGALAAGTWAVNLAMSANPFVAVAVAVAALGFALVKAYHSSATFRNIVVGTWSAIKSVANTVFPIIKTAMHDGLLGPLGWAITHFGTIKTVAKDAFGAIKTAVGLVSGAIKGIASAVGGIVSAFKSVIGFASKLNPLKLFSGDGPGRGGKPGGPPPGGPGPFSGSLMGARPSLAPFAAVGSRFGLHVTDGKRPAGTRTASGGVSYHSSGEAIDMGDGRGPDAQKLGFFKYMKSRFGSRLAELIYTPGGAGIKDGRPFNYTGAVAAEHYDHVHVAYDTGAPGVGDGPGRMSRFGTGDGIGFKATAQLAESVGLPGVTFAQIAHGESGYDPKAIGHDPGGTTGLGLWQITTGFNDDIIAKYGGQKAMLNAHTNALAARDIWRRQGRAAWYGTRYVTGWDLHYKGKLPKRKAGTGKDPGEGKISGPHAAPGSGHGESTPGGGSGDNAATAFAHQQGLSLKGRHHSLKGVLRPGGSAGDSSGGSTSGDDAAAAAKALTDALLAVKASIDAQTAFATGVANTSNYQLTKTLSDMISGHIVGYGVAGRAFTPGTGVEHVY